MCLILITWGGHPTRRCVVAANRDEFHSRATAPAHWWTDNPQILAGRDLEAGGTWLGVTRMGRFAALTNFRGASPKRADAKSRGLLVSDFLRSETSVAKELTRLTHVAMEYNGFNLMISDGSSLGIFESITGAGRELGPGTYGLSNHLLDTPWPKVETAKSRMLAALDGDADASTLLPLLRDPIPAPDEMLPNTGVGLEWERMLSSAFILGEEYGTRCSTVLMMDSSGSIFFDEWSWNPTGIETARTHMEFALDDTLPRPATLHA